MAGPSLSVVVVVHDMARELPRTLRTLSPDRQRGLTADDYEIIVVDNGSAQPLSESSLRAFPGTLRSARIAPAPPSPVTAANHGLAMAGGDLVGLIIDGARLVTPGLLSAARSAALLSPSAVITAPAWHLGPTTHMEASATGYDQQVEDSLLSASGWEADGYELFGISTPAGSSARGLFGPMGESSSLFLSASAWRDLGGLDERFDLPGGGLANHDLYRRACEQAGADLIVLLGEGTFHQYHGGAATSRVLSWSEMHAQYEHIRGHPYQPPNADPLFIGRVPPALLSFIERSAQTALKRRPETSGDQGR